MKRARLRMCQSWTSRNWIRMEPQMVERTRLFASRNLHGPGWTNVVLSTLSQATKGLVCIGAGSGHGYEDGTAWC